MASDRMALELVNLFRRRVAGDFSNSKFEVIHLFQNFMEMVCSLCRVLDLNGLFLNDGTCHGKGKLLWSQ